MTISEQMIEVINALCEKFGIAIDWTAKNVLPYIQELLNKFVNYEIATSIFWIAFMMLTTIGVWILFKPCCKKAQEDDWDDDSGWFVATIFLGVIGFGLVIVTIIVVAVQTLDIVTATTFPEKIILEELQGLIATNAK